MQQLDQKHQGALGEHIACAWLLAQGYETFRNVSQHGIADLVAWKPGEKPILIDVKTTARLKGSASKYRRPTEAQRKAGIRVLTVDPLRGLAGWHLSPVLTPPASHLKTSH